MQPVHRHIFNRHLSRGVQRRGHHARWRLDLVFSRPDPAHVLERPDQAYRAMAAHAKVAHIVEIDHRRLTRWIEGLQQNCANHNIRTARLIHHARPEKVVSLAKACKPFHQRSAAEVRAAVDHHSGRFTSCMGINYLD
jgi:hypothetical protein